MKNTSELPKMMVAMSEDTVSWLLSLRTSPTDNLDGVVSRLRECNTESAKYETTNDLRSKKDEQGKYVCTIFDHQVSAQNLYELFGTVVDFMDERHPEVLDKLAGMHRSNARNFIARERKNVHIRRADLGTMMTKSGWWIDTNIGRREVVNALQALCSAAGLEFGEDIRFLS